MPRKESTSSRPDEPTIETIDELLWEVARDGARRLLQRAMESEIETHLKRHTDLVTREHCQAVVRNGNAPKRTILTGVGPVEIQRPRVDERRAVELDRSHDRFASGILPRFLRRTPTIEGTLAVLYLNGISGNDFDAALQAIYGEDAGSLSASTTSRLKEAWYEEYEAWRKTPLSSHEYAYIWADGVYFNARVEGEKSCILVVSGAKFNGEKELLAIGDGVRESEVSWKELLLELKARGITVDPKLATADGALGFWKALPQVFPTTGSATVLGAQDGERAGKDAQERPATSEDAAPRYLPRRDREGGGEGV